MSVIFKPRDTWYMSTTGGLYSQVGDVLVVEDGQKDVKIATWAIGNSGNAYKTQFWHHGCDQWVEYPSVKFCSLRDALDYVSRWTEAVTLAGHFVDRV